MDEQMDKEKSRDKSVREEIFSLLQYRMMLSLAPSDRIYAIDLPQERPDREEAVHALHDLLLRDILSLGEEDCSLTEKGKALVLPAACACLVLKVFSLSEEEESRVLYLGETGILSVQITPSGEVRLRSLSEEEVLGEILPEEEGPRESASGEVPPEGAPYEEEYALLSAAEWPAFTDGLSAWRDKVSALVLADRLRLDGGSPPEGQEPERERFVFLRKTYDSYILIQTEKEMERENGMKYDVKLFPDDKTVLSVKMEGKENRLLYRTLAKYNEDITDENIEEASATVCNDLIVGTITAFSGQTGLVYVWNPLTVQIEHVSEGSYAVRAMLVGDKLYSLLYISSWGKKPEFQLCRIEFGVKDPERESEVIPIPENISGCPWPADGEVELDVEDNLIHITIGDENASVSI